MKPTSPFFWRACYLLVALLLRPGLPQAQSLKLMLPIGHTGGISWVDYSPDGKHVATASDDKTVKVWDLATGALLLDLIGHTAPIGRVEYSPNGKKLLTSSADGTRRLWDASTGGLLATLPEMSDFDYWQTTFSPNGSQILTLDEEEKFGVWDASSGKRLLKLESGFMKVGSPGSSDFAVVSPVAAFSPDGTRILTSTLSTKLWNAKSGALLLELKVPGKPTVYTHAGGTFNADGRRVAAPCTDHTVRVWDALKGTLSLTLSGGARGFSSVVFSPNGQQLLTTESNEQNNAYTTRVWNALTGKQLYALPNADLATYSPDSKRLLTAGPGTAINTRASSPTSLRDALTGKVLATWSGLPVEARHQVAEVAFIPAFSPDGRQVRILDSETIRVWDVASRTLLQTTRLDNYSHQIRASIFSPDGRRVATALDSTVRIWDVATGTPLLTISNQTAWKIPFRMVLTLSFSPDGRQLATTSLSDHLARVWDSRTGALLLTLEGHQEHVRSASFSHDGHRIVTAAWDGTAKIWDAATGKLLLDLKGQPNIVEDAAFSPDDRRVITTAHSTMSPKPGQVVKSGASANVWDARSGKLLLEIQNPDGPGFRAIDRIIFSADGQRIVGSASANEVNLRKVNGQSSFHYTPYAYVWSASDGQLLLELKDDAAYQKYMADPAISSVPHSARELGVAMARQQAPQTTFALAYSPDGRQVATVTEDGSTQLWDATTGALQRRLPAQGGYTHSVAFSPDSKRLLLSRSNSVELIDLSTGRLIYRYLPVLDNDFLAVDQYSRYEGTPAARDLLYFTCGSEIISLDQVKEQLWVPGLASRLSRGEAINAKALADLNLCGLVPEVKPLPGKDQGYHYQVLPRRGGLGETVLSVNGIEVKRYSPSQLTKTPAGYELALPRTALLPYFADGKANTVTVKAYTKTDNLASRGADVLERRAATSTAHPNLYAVMVGVSDYKDDELDLKYAAKDAQDLAAALGSSARKLLNTDGQQHVFVYNLTTNPTHDKLPEKTAIRQTFEEIGRKTTANDIVLVFLAGHGVVNATTKKFYFLTADASNRTATTGAVTEVGLSTQELTEWMQPSRIRAQKRVLILDACNSGQAIDEVVSAAARSDDQAQQAKALDRLNEQAGMFILAASASNQSAYEMSGYAQGLLTYSLLEALKNHPDILEEHRYLNLGRWFDAARQTVTDVARDMGRQQQSQVHTTTNFNIGVVDAEVLATITLPTQKTLFSSSNFQNKDEAVASDDLGLNRLLDAELNTLASRGGAAPLAFAESTASPDAYTLTGRYDAQGSKVKVRVDVRKGKVSLNRFEEAGTREELKALAAAIAAHATAWVEKNK